MDVKPVRVTTTLLNPSTFVGVNEIVALLVDEARELSRLTLKFNKPVEGVKVIPGKKPVVVVSRTVVAVIVAAATLVHGFRGTLGLLMFVQTNDIHPTLVSAAEAELKVTVNTPDVRVAVAK